MVADIEELERMDASEIHAPRLHAKRGSDAENGEHFILPVPDGTVKLSGRSGFPKILRRTNMTLDVLLESRIDDYWNVDGGRELSEPWTGVTQ